MRIRPISPATQVCTVVDDQSRIHERHIDLLGDESKLQAEYIEAIYLPASAAQVCWAIQDIRNRDASCVISAGRTGIAGGAVPLGAQTIISLAGLNRPLGFGFDGCEYYLRVEPGMTLASLTGLLRKKDFAGCLAPTPLEEQAAAGALADEGLQLWLPVNPTETSAQIGGMVATNASGSRSFRYGATRDWVRALTVVLADGRMLKLRRGEIRAENGCFLLEEEDGPITSIKVDDVALPPTKATLGYPLRKDMDLIDLFIGSEGTLGVIVEVELRLSVRPQSTVGVLAMVPDEDMVVKLVKAARTSRSVRFDAIEYFDRASLLLLKEKKQAEGAAGHLPDLPNWDGCGVYLELSGSEEETEKGCEALEAVLQSVGLSIDETWAAMEPGELAAQRLFRHAVPEEVNAIIGRRKVGIPGLHKVGTDMAVPDDRLEELMALYREDLARLGIDSVVFGHIGDNHLHVNLLPRNMEELDQAEELYRHWAGRVVAMGGAVAAEHGIGRMKKKLLEVQYPPQILELMRQVRRAFDPRGLLAPGVLFD